MFEITKTRPQNSVVGFVLLGKNFFIRSGKDFGKFLLIV